MNKFLNVLSSYIKYDSIVELLEISNNIILDDIYVSRLYQTFFPEGYSDLSLKELRYLNKVILSNKRYFDDELDIKFILYLVIKICFMGGSCVGIITKNKDILSNGLLEKIDNNTSSNIELLKGTKYNIQFCNGSSIHIISDHIYCRGMSLQYLFIDKTSYTDYDDIRKNILGYFPYITKIIEF